MDIGEVARASGLPASTLRYYEEKGLIQSTGRKGLRRTFHSDVVKRLEFIALGIQAGFALDEIAAMFNNPQSQQSRQPQIDRQQLLDKADELDHKITRLTRMRDGLRHAAKCSAPDHFQCSTFQRLLKLAGKNRGKKARKSD